MGRRSITVLFLWAVGGSACGDPGIAAAPPALSPDPGPAASSAPSPSSGGGRSGSTSGTDSPANPGPSDSPGTDDSPAAPDDTQVPADLESCLSKYMTSGHLPGLSACLVKNQRIAWCGSVGLANIEKQVKVTEHTPFLLASVSKTITATAMMRLWEDGVYRLDDKIADLLDFTVKNPRFSTPITYRHLLTHGSSIIDDWNIIDTYYRYDTDPQVSLGDTLKGYFSAANQATIYSANQPGSVNEYSNIGLDLLGFLLEALSGEDFAENCRKNIFVPLEMKDTSWWLRDFPDRDRLAMPYVFQNSRLTPTGHVTFSDYPSGGLRSSAYDLARFLLAYLQSGALEGYQLLKKETIAEMMKPQFQNLEGSTYSQGLVWFLFSEGGQSYAEHSGSESGAATQIFFRSDGLGLTLLTNGDHDETAMLGLKSCLLQFAKRL